MLTYGKSSLCIDQSVRQRSFCYCYKLVSHTLTLEDVSSRRRKLPPYGTHRTVTTWKASPGLEAGANLWEAQRPVSSVSPSDRRAAKSRGRCHSTLIRQSSHCLGNLRTKGTRRVFHLSGSNVLVQRANCSSTLYNRT